MADKQFSAPNVNTRYTFSSKFLVQENRWPEPGGGGKGTGDGRRMGGKRDLYDGGKRERNSKGKLSLFCYCLHPVKETNPTTFVDFYLTSSEA